MITRMHSSTMRTAQSLTISHSIQCPLKENQVSIWMQSNNEANELNTGQTQLIQSHSLARFCCELSGNLN